MSSLLLRWRGWLEGRQLLAHWPWWLLLAGLLLEACMQWLPLVPFAGEDQLRPLLEDQNSTEAWVLLLSAIVKLLMLGLCLETGWRSGVFFPLFLVACALGMGLHLLLPDLGSLGSWCGASRVRCTASCCLLPWRFWYSGLLSCRAMAQPACW